jgi:hypothetical protein
MKTKKMMELDIQLFAEDNDAAANEMGTDAANTETVEEPEVKAEEETTVNEQNDQETVTEEAEKPVKKSTKDYSERLKADREKIRKEIEEENNKRLDNIAKSRGFDNWKELEEYSNKEQLQNLGVNDSEAFEKYLNNVIESNPEIIQARQIIAEQKQREAERQLNDQLIEISKLDTSIKTINDLVAHPSYDRVLDRVTKGESLLDAFKLENFEALTGRATDAAVQHTLNNINNKGHVKTTTGSSTNDVVVPSDIYAMYKRNLPTWSDEQIKKHYAKEMGVDD